jgi:hypothetical protein
MGDTILSVSLPLPGRLVKDIALSIMIQTSETILGTVFSSLIVRICTRAKGRHHRKRRRMR